MSEELSRAGEPMFTLVRRGYDPVEVDGYVSQLHHQLRGLQKPEQAVTDALEEVGNQVADILKQAHETARQVVETAETSAAETTREAETQAANMLAAAEKRLQDIDIDTDRVWAERARIVSDVRELSRQLLSVADLAEERFPDDPDEVAVKDAVVVTDDPATTEYFQMTVDQDTAEFDAATVVHPIETDDDESGDEPAAEDAATVAEVDGDAETDDDEDQ